tara:strand:+ start:178 stop:384 length:207 start_codon:yes stop_codon:yes gene_type:complete
MLDTEGRLTTLNDWVIYGLALTGGFISNHWYEMIFLAFAGVHAYIALDKWRYERSVRAIIANEVASST